MTYNFDEKIDRRGTNAMKLSGYRDYIFQGDETLDLPFTDEELIHLWVADMEFAVAPEILEAISKRLDRKILGYTGNFDSRLYTSFRKWCNDRYDFDFKEEELLLSNGVVPAIIKTIELVVAEEQSVLFNTPAYGQFAVAAKIHERKIEKSPLIRQEDGSYCIDFEDLDQKMAEADVPLYILSNPHNPTGEAWTEEELAKVAELVEKHDVWLLSDEIHADIRRQNAPRHIPMGKIMPDYDKLITCMSASKTFNIAGLAESCILVRNEKLRRKWAQKANVMVNPLSHEALIAAYEKGEDWLYELTQYLDENFSLLKDYFKKYLPEAVVSPAQTTYLAWVDLSSYFEEEEDVERFFAEKAGVLIEADKTFVDDANRMVRINFACPREYLKEGLEKIKNAIDNRC